MSKLNILWGNDNPDTAHTMVFMYAINGIQKSWWDEIDVIIWGASAKLVAENIAIQEKINMAKHAGVNVIGCIACATQFGVVDKLQSLNIELKPMGEPLTKLLKNDEKLITI